MKKSELTEIIREVIKETIRKVDDKYVVYPEKGGKRLGTHSSKKAAEKQLTAIHLNKEAVNEQEMSQDDFNTIGNVLRDSTKAKQIHSLLLQMFPQQKELLNYNYKNDSYAEFKRFIFHIDKYKLEGPVSINHTDLKLDPENMKSRERKYQDYINGKIDKYFRDTNADPRKVDLSKVPPITVDQTGEVMDGNHRAFLAIKQQKPLKGYKIVNTNNTHPNVAKILQIVGKEVNENYADGEVKDQLSKYIDDYSEIDVSLLKKLLKDKKKYPKQLDPRSGGNKFGYRGMTFKKEFIDKLKRVRTSNGVTEYEVPSNLKVNSRSDKGYLSFTTEEEVAKGFGHYSGYVDHKKTPDRVGGYVRVSLDNPNFILHPSFTGELSKDLEYSKESEKETLFVGNSFTPDKIYVVDENLYKENYADGKVKGKSRPGRVKKAGASCKGSVTDLRAKAKKYGGEKGKMYHWCANMKSGKK